MQLQLSRENIKFLDFFTSKLPDFIKRFTLLILLMLLNADEYVMCNTCKMFSVIDKLCKMCENILHIECANVSLKESIIDDIELKSFSVISIEWVSMLLSHSIRNNKDLLSSFDISEINNYFIQRQIQAQRIDPTGRVPVYFSKCDEVHCSRALNFQ
uniref:Uncharacterized protein n=1 Tax=Glossina austeni TaxID=7395 RepID=A0A1A9V3X4_GLOAU